MVTEKLRQESPTDLKGFDRPLFDLCVIGQGHIGLPTAVVFASADLNVLGVDVQPQLVDELNDAITHITEPGLQDSLRSVIKQGNYKAALAPEQSAAYIVSVPTPIDDQNQPVLDFIIAAAKTVAPLLQEGSLVILESTVPPGTTAGIFASTLAANSTVDSSDYLIAHCPERVLPGQILHELIHNDRVIGGLTDEASQNANQLYRKVVKGEIVFTNATTAELVKLSENIYRDVNIGLANELAEVAESLGVDVWEATNIANLHPRVNIHQPGPGVGGYCIPVASIFLGAGTDVPTPTIDGARQINSVQPNRAIERISQLLKDIDNPVVAVMGVAYKGNVGDARATPADDVIRGLEAVGATVKVHDPFSVNSRHDLVSADSALEGADAAMFLTDHDQFSEVDPEATAKLMRGKTVFDGRNILPVQAWEAAGFSVLRLGDGTTNSAS